MECGPHSLIISMNSHTLRLLLALLGGLLLASSVCAAATTPVGDTLTRPALMVHDATQVSLLGIGRAGNRLVAVGERGIIRLSDDDGKSWRQVKSPVSVSLTSVRFVGAKMGWAIGHRGVVLHTEDQGETWVRQLDGKMIEGVMSTFVHTLGQQGGVDAGSERIAAAARQIINDGPDKPLFDLYFKDEKTGFVIGAYGLAFVTTDGGHSWTPALNRMENPRGLHLYSIQGEGDDIYIAGEQGLLLRSRNRGQSFAKVNTPYRGTYFAVSTPASGQVIVAGLNGNAYRSGDSGVSWSKLDIGTMASFSAFLHLTDRTLLLSDQSGHVFASRDAGHNFKQVALHAIAPLSAIAAGADGSLIGVGLLGVVHLSTKPIDITGVEK